jgi:hypothetical protein
MRFDTIYDDVLCEQFERGGGVKTKCTDDALDPRSVQFYVTDGVKCEAWWADDCRGPSDEQQAGYTQCKTDEDSYRSFTCTR